MSAPRFSMLSPVFNEQLHVAEMIESVQAQTVDSWEIVFADDGSDDSTVDIIRTYAAGDPRIRLVHEGEHVGKVRAMNLAFAASRGELLFHLAGDDRLPPDALAVRGAAFDADGPAGEPVQAAFFKMRTFSSDPKFDGLELPKGRAASRTGASPTYVRELAERMFPVPEALPSEDLWLGFLSRRLATTTREAPTVAWLYRIHGGNSNPRHKGFAEMSRSIAARAEVWTELRGAAARLGLSADAREEIDHRWEVERDRRDGRLLAILRRRGVPLVDRLAICSAANPGLFWIRSRFYRTFTGLRRS